MTKLTQPQITALQFLTKGPWVASWWGGKPQTTLPKELPATTLSKLVTLRYIKIAHVGRFDRAMTITKEGLKALKRHDPVKE